MNEKTETDPRFLYGSDGRQTGLNWDYYRERNLRRVMQEEAESRADAKRRLLKKKEKNGNGNGKKKLQKVT